MKKIGALFKMILLGIKQLGTFFARAQNQIWFQTSGVRLGMHAFAASPGATRDQFRKPPPAPSPICILHGILRQKVSCDVTIWYGVANTTTTCHMELLILFCDCGEDARDWTQKKVKTRQCVSHPKA